MEPETEQRYFYSYRFHAKDPDAPKRDEPSKAEIQDFVNEILGITKERRLEQQASGV